MVDTQRRTLQTLMEPAALYRILEYHQTNLHPIFEGASHVALCICTIGAGVERAAQDLTQNGELLKGFILDSLGSEAAEEVARLSNDVVAMRARAMGLRSGKRFSPGYGIWDLREQAWIFEVLPAQRVGVTLTDDFLMLPRKSVSYRVNFN